MKRFCLLLWKHLLVILEVLLSPVYVKDMLMKKSNSKFLLAPLKLFTNFENTFTNSLQRPYSGELILGILTGNRTWSCSQILSPWLRDIVDSRIGLSCCSPSAYVVWRAGTTTLFQSRLYHPSQGLRIWLQDHRRSQDQFATIWRGNNYNKNFIAQQNKIHPAGTWKCIFSILESLDGPYIYHTKFRLVQLPSSIFLDL